MRRQGAGVAYGLAAYIAWGISPIYFKLVASIPPMEVLAHRVVWSVLLLAFLLTVRSRWGEIRAALRRRRTMINLCITTLLIANNWYWFIWAVSNDHVLQASLGYFINPLVNVGLGVLFLRERLTRAQVAGLMLAGAGVLYLAMAHEGVPWVALMLAFSFGFYAMLRKRSSVEAMSGLMIETTLLLPAGMIFLLWIGMKGEGTFGSGTPTQHLLLFLAGAVTLFPLLWFTEAARRVRLSTLGFMQYIAPTGQFLLAVLLYRETFTGAHAVAFTCIWAALVIYTVDSAIRLQRNRRMRDLAIKAGAPAR
ncbi:MAG: EamA family transporter RarD [Phycisphaeraceae bacterium]|nr:MAG: EamA family transporter RarD [Phycisphaeraceae bacterium]